MKLNKSTNDAIQILMECARAGDALVKVADISSRLDITPQNVFKIVHILSRSDLVAAMRGRYGGVRLARAPDKIRIGDIVRAMEATGFETIGVAGRNAGARDVGEVLDCALEAFLGVLDQHSLADMMLASKKTKSPRPDKKVRPRPMKAAERSMRTRTSGIQARAKP